MPRPTPPVPSPRVYVTLGVAALLGAITFLIWWATSPAPAPGPENATAAKEPASFVLPRGGTLTGTLRDWPADATPVRLAPIAPLANDEAGAAIAALTQATLVRIDRRTDRPEAWLAQSWTVSPDGLTYTFRLRPNTLWSDGAPLTASQVVASIEAAYAQGATSSALMIEGKPLAARALDPLTVEVAFPAPFAPALRLLSRLPVVMPPAQPAARGATPARTATVGTAGLGPFVLTELTAQRMTFSKNAHYWHKTSDGSPLPYLDRIILERASDSDSGLDRLQTRQLDFRSGEAPAADYAVLRAADTQAKLRLYDLGPSLDADALWFNLAKPVARGREWLTSEDFRLAISAVVDRRAYCQTLFAGRCDPIGGPVTTGNREWFLPELPVGRPNPEQARTLLAGLDLIDRNSDGVLDSAAGRPVQFTILVPLGAAASANGAAFVRDELQKVGIAATVTPLAPDLLRARWLRGDYDAIFDRVGTADTDPAMNLDYWLSSGGRHLWNPSQKTPATEWEAQIDRLMQTTARSSDRVERLQAFAQAQRTLAEHMPAIYLGARYVYVATGMRLLNAAPSPLPPVLLWSADALAATP